MGRLTFSEGLSFARFSSPLCFPRRHGVLRRIPPALGDGPTTTTTTIFEFISQGPIFQFRGAPGCCIKCPFCTLGKQRKDRDSSSDVSSGAVLMRHQRQNYFCKRKVVMGKSLDSPGKQDHDKMSKNVRKMSKKCLMNIVQSRCRRQNVNIFGHFLNIWSVFLSGNPVQCTPITILWLWLCLGRPCCLKTATLWLTSANGACTKSRGPPEVVATTGLPAAQASKTTWTAELLTSRTGSFRSKSSLTQTNLKGYQSLVAPCGWEFNRGRGCGWESQPISHFCFALVLKRF